MSEIKKIFITGASSGLGRALALQAVSKGWDCLALGRDLKALQGLQREASAFGKGRLLPLEADLSHRDGVSDLFEKAERIIGHPIDILINNAGYSLLGLAEEIPQVEWERCLQVNFLAAASLSRQALSQMRHRGNGTIVNITSGTAGRAVPFEGPYCAAKAALRSMTESMRVEARGSGVSIIDFSPGPIASGFFERRTRFGKASFPLLPFHGKDPDEIAKILWHAIQRSKGHVTLGWKARIIQALNSFSPRMVDEIFCFLYRMGKEKRELSTK